MNSSKLLGFDGTPLINRFSNDVHDSTQGLRANRNSDWCTRIQDFLTSNQAFCTIHSNGPYCALTQMLGHLQNQPGLPALHLQGI